MSNAKGGRDNGRRDDDCDDDSDGGNGLKGLVLHGTNGNNTLTGGRGNDHLFGRDGNDTLTGGKGDDKLDGGKGFDTAVFGGSYFDYLIDIKAQGKEAPKITVKGPDGTDTLHNIEALQFGDRTIYLDRNNAPIARNDTVSATEDTRLVIPAASLLANDVDPDGNSLRIVEVGGAVNGTVSLNATGGIVFDPAQNFSGPASFTYKVSDGKGGFTTATVLVNVNAVADQPILAAANVSGSDAVELDIQAALADTDGSETLSLRVTGVPSGAILSAGTANADGSWTLTAQQLDGLTLTAAPGFDGDITLTVTATATETSNGASASRSASFVAHIDGQRNTPPVAEDATVTTDEDTALTGGQLVASDAENQLLTFALVTGPASGQVTVGADGTYTYVPDANFFGTDSFTFRVTDSLGASDEGVITIVVLPVNDAPVVATIDDQRVNAGAVFGLNVSGAFSDVDSALTLSASELPDWLVFDATTGTFSTPDGVPEAEAGEQFEITVTGDDGEYSVSETFVLEVGGIVWTGTDEPEIKDGTKGDDALAGGLGDDTLRGADGADALSGQGGGDRLEGGDGDDTVDGGDGNDRLSGGADDDVIIGGDGNDELAGDRDSEIFLTAGGNDQLFGGAGDDILYTSDGVDLLDGGADLDLFIVRNVQGATITTGSGIDTIAIQAHLQSAIVVTDFDAGVGGDILDLQHYVDNSLLGWDGDSNPFGNGFLSLVQVGNDTVLTVDDDGDGNLHTSRDLVVFLDTRPEDFIAANFFPIYNPTGEPSAGEVFIGGNGDDTFTGGDGNDSAFGNGGIDQLSGGPGDDLLDGGAGTDVLAGDTGDDTVRGGDDDDTLSGGDDDDVLEGDGGNDTLDGNAGADTLFGGEGNDILLNGDDYDILDGGAGDDRFEITGATVTTGAGADTVVLTSLFEASVITDFEPGDVIDVTPHLSTSFWDGVANPFVSGHLRLVQDGGNTRLEMDGDGAENGPGYELLMTLEGTQAHTFVAADFGFSESGDFVAGSADNDSLMGMGGNDFLFGFTVDEFLNPVEDGGDDVLAGGDGDDVLLGGIGNDSLRGGAGADQHIGGEGSDTFVFASGDGVDLIHDFTFAEGDQLDISEVLEGYDSSEASYTLEASGLFSVDPDGATGPGEAVGIAVLSGLGSNSEDLDTLLNSHLVV